MSLLRLAFGSRKVGVDNNNTLLSKHIWRRLDQLLHRCILFSNGNVGNVGGVKGAGNRWMIMMGG